MMIASVTHIPVRILQSHNTKLSDSKCKEVRNKLALPFLKATTNTNFACGQVAGRSMFHHQPFTVIPNTISSNQFSFNSSVRMHIRKKYNCQDKVIIGTVARIAKQKNPLFAMKVIKYIAKKNPNIEYWWIGSGELDNKVQKYIDDNHLNKYIKLFGSSDDVSELYQAMDVFFLPSLFEGLPIVAIEAQATGLPCVISASVTRELVYTDLVKFVSLDSNINFWVKAIMDQADRLVNRSSYRIDLQNSKYYLPKATEILEEKYIELLNTFVNERERYDS